jgi:hypothetical protein
VEYGSQRFELQSPDGLTFGRAATCTIRLDPDDLGISRLAGSLESGSGTWWLTNRSTGRPLSIADDIGIRTLLAPGRRIALAGPATVIVEGSKLRHAIEISIEVEEAGVEEPGPLTGEAGAPQAGAPEAGTPEAGTPEAGTPEAGTPDAAPGGTGPDPDAPMPTSTAGGVVVNEQDRLALVALFAGYLEAFPRYDPYPRSYADAAADLGWPRTTLVKRIEYLRTRLTHAGVPNLLGETALAHLAEWVLATGVLARGDLELLRRHRDARVQAGQARNPR